MKARPEMKSQVRYERDARLTCLASMLVAAMILSTSAPAQEIAVTQGRRIAEVNCGGCHATGRDGDSAMAIAPPFRSLHMKYPVEDLEESLAEGIMTGHPTMPQFRFDADQIRDFIAYLKTLEAPRKAPD